MKKFTKIMLFLGFTAISTHDMYGAGRIVKCVGIAKIVKHFNAGLAKSTVKKVMCSNCGWRPEGIRAPYFCDACSSWHKLVEFQKYERAMREEAYLSPEHVHYLESHSAPKKVQQWLDLLLRNKKSDAFFDRAHARLQKATSIEQLREICFDLHNEMVEYFKVLGFKQIYSKRYIYTHPEQPGFVFKIGIEACRTFNAHRVKGAENMRVAERSVDRNHPDYKRIEPTQKYAHIIHRSDKATPSDKIYHEQVIIVAEKEDLNKAKKLSPHCGAAISLLQDKIQYCIDAHSGNFFNFGDHIKCVDTEIPHSSFAVYPPILASISAESPVRSRL